MEAFTVPRNKLWLDLLVFILLFCSTDDFTDTLMKEQQVVQQTRIYFLLPPFSSHCHIVAFNLQICNWAWRNAAPSVHLNTWLMHNNRDKQPTHSATASKHHLARKCYGWSHQITGAERLWITFKVTKCLMIICGDAGTQLQIINHKGTWMLDSSL